MLDHIGISVTDLARSQAFYEAALQPLGVRLVAGDGEHYAGYGTGRRGFLWLYPAATAPSRVHIALACEDRDLVHRFHAAALAAGGTDNGAPGLRPHYHADYYGAFVLDPDGHNIEVVCHKAM